MEMKTPSHRSQNDCNQLGEESAARDTVQYPACEQKQKCDRTAKYVGKDRSVSQEKIQYISEL